LCDVGRVAVKHCFKLKSFFTLIHKINDLLIFLTINCQNSVYLFVASGFLPLPYISIEYRVPMPWPTQQTNRWELCAAAPPHPTFCWRRLRRS